MANQNVKNQSVQELQSIVKSLKKQCSGLKADNRRLRNENRKLYDVGLATRRHEKRACRSSIRKSCPSPTRAMEYELRAECGDEIDEIKEAAMEQFFAKQQLAMPQA